MSYRILPYDRDAAVRYAHQWAYGRNPLYYNYDELGGDCTNFASQCLYAGSGVMNHTPTFGWYYYDANRKAPAWTGVEYFCNFLTREKPSLGPFAKEVTLRELLPGDIVQLSFSGAGFQHSPIVVQAGESASDLLLAAHTDDADYRSLDTYPYVLARFLHIFGVYQM